MCECVCCSLLGKGLRGLLAGAIHSASKHENAEMLRNSTTLDGRMVLLISPGISVPLVMYIQANTGSYHTPIQVSSPRHY